MASLTAAAILFLGFILLTPSQHLSRVMFPLSSPFRPKAPPPSPPTSSHSTASALPGNHHRLYFPIAVSPAIHRRLVPTSVDSVKALPRSGTSAAPGQLRRPTDVYLPWGNIRPKPDPPDGASLAPWFSACYRNLKNPDGPCDDGGLASNPDRKLRLTAMDLTLLQAGGLRRSREVTDPAAPDVTSSSASLQAPWSVAGENRSKEAARLPIQIWHLGFIGKWGNKVPDFFEKMTIDPWAFLVPADWRWSSLAPAFLGLTHHNPRCYWVPGFWTPLSFAPSFCRNSLIQTSGWLWYRDGFDIANV